MGHIITRPTIPIEILRLEQLSVVTRRLVGAEMKSKPLRIPSQIELRRRARQIRLREHQLTGRDQAIWREAVNDLDEILSRNGPASQVQIAKRAAEICEREGRSNKPDSSIWETAKRELEDSPRGFLERTLDWSTALEGAEELVARHAFSHQKVTEFTRMLAAIRAKADDPNLYLAVIGEFSTGKSTLINAFLRTDLLRSDIWQGTTAAATFISYGPEQCEAIEVEFVDGSTIEAERRPNETFCDYLRRITANEVYAKEVHRVFVHHRGPENPAMLVIIDTPGINAESHRHVQVTEQTLREWADAALIVTAATEPLPMTLCGFLRVHLRHSLPRCVLGITKIDLIPKEKRADLVENIRRRYLKELELQSPKLVALSPRVIVLMQSPDSPDVAEELGRYDGDRETLAQSFSDTEAELREFLVCQRQTLLAERMARLWEGMLSTLRTELANREEKYLKQHELLEKSRLRNLSDFVSERQKETRARLNQKFLKLSSRLDSEMYHFEQTAFFTRRSEIEAAEMSTALQAIAKSSLRAKCIEARAKASELLAKLRSELMEEAELVLLGFEEEFQLRELTEESTSLLREAHKELLNIVAATIDHYADHYQENIDRLIEEDNQDVGLLERTREIITKDIQWINERLNDLKELHAELSRR
jgi:hypothetical protein